MTDSDHLTALGAFFRARRAEVSPDQVPEHVISPAGRRRVSGLRREEVAQLAAVSTDYYVRVEQGRLAPSDAVFASLCHTYSLSPEQLAYAEDLLNRARGLLGPATGREPAHERLQLLLDRIHDLPALLLGPRMDILAWNFPATRLLLDFSKLPIAERNYVSLLFSDPSVRALYEDWSEVARTCVGILRREAVENPADPELIALVGRLSIISEDFRRWWAEHQVAEQDFGSKMMIHPTAGRMRLSWDSFTVSGGGRQQLVLWSAAEPGPDADSLATLLSEAP